MKIKNGYIWLALVIAFLAGLIIGNEVASQVEHECELITNSEQR